MTVVTLLSDFGTSDTYVGQLKGVLLGIAPDLSLVDLTHAVPPQDVLEGAFQLATAWRAFPPETVHLAVVDPGVGTSRRAIAVRAGDHYFVLPDNGLISLVRLDAPFEVAVMLAAPAHASPTFHGRDVFAPAAARLALVGELRSVGKPIALDSLVRLPVAGVARSDAAVRAPVVSIDHFGNCRTLLRPAELPGPPGQLVVRCGALRVAGVRRAYGDVAVGQPLALFGSHDGLELAVRDGHAAREWNITRGALVEVEVR
ncbi:MAG TPA: SAM-dependent chlorinase/fluorinase [Thermomicrobiaceae bacterium]|nr:SAM-dependent chlorinase/fluorinase [Thermomicrobiaceae bacterium]